MVKLSIRLQKIAEYITTGSRVADIGSDHALLPVYLLQSGKCPTAVAGELNFGPFQAAQKQAAAAGLTDKLDVRQGDGLSILKPGEADTVTIAGMGGSLMAEILEAGNRAGKLVSVRELVLQPNVGEEAVRRWLVSNGWFLRDEAILEEDGKIYEIMHAIRTDDAEADNDKLYNGSFLPIALDTLTMNSILMRMGPYLLRRNEPILVKKWQHELRKLKRICEQLSDSELPESAIKLEQFQVEMNVLEEVLGCLPMARR